MPQTRPDVSGDSAHPAAPAPRAEPDDPLSRLHKMSTTAGLGSGDYVAINTLSVASVLLGLASVLAILGNVLLVIPVAGVVSGIIALRQIGRSNGTQMGRPFAWAGIILSIGLGGYIIAAQIAEAAATREDEREVAGVIEQLGESIQAEDWDAAYALFSDRFRQRIDRGYFIDRWRAMQGGPYGRVESMEWNRRLQFQVDRTTGTRFAIGQVLVHFDRVEVPGRYDLQFRRTPDGWMIENAPQLFPTEEDMEMETPDPMAPEGPMPMPGPDFGPLPPS